MSSSTSTSTSTSSFTSILETKPEEIQAQLRVWFESLDEKEKVIHELASKMLESRYCPERCNNFIEWTRNKKDPKA